MRKNWTWIKSDGYKRHKTEREAISYMRAVAQSHGHAGYDKLKTADTGIDPEAGFYTDDEIADILRDK